MGEIISILCIVLVCLLSAVKSQTDTSLKEEQAVIIPPEIILPVVVPQPDCPLQFEHALVIEYLTGRVAEAFKVRNRGTKPIRSYTLARLESDHAESIIDLSGDDADGVLQPNQVSPSQDETDRIKFVDLTDDLRDKLKLRGALKGIVMFMIVRVEFSDGSVYTADSKFQSLEKYIKELQLTWGDNSDDTRNKLKTMKSPRCKQRGIKRDRVGRYFLSGLVAERSS